MARPFEGRIAVIVDGGTPSGRAFALALAARGARVVVAGPSERALAETVGEIAFSGGKARHVVGGVDEAVARAAALWGAVDVVVETALDRDPEEPR
jgi:NAD(P)-dependent dehydrogenase (short-subunit alcohol dehydrogenase family)